MALVVSLAGRRAFLAQVTPYLATCYVRLFATDYVPLSTSTEVDFVEPVYDGYGPIAVPAFPPCYINPAGQGEADAPTVTFRVGPAGGSSGVWGYWITTVSGQFVLAERFALAPVPMVLPGATCPIRLRVLSGDLC